MKKIFFIALFFLLAAAVFFVLLTNKNKLDMKQKISEAQLEIVPVMIDTAKKRMLGENDKYAALLNPVKELMVVSQTQGEVEQVSAKVGDYAKKGQVIVSVDDDILQANLLVAEASYEKAEKDLTRFENLIEENGITQDQLEKMRLNLKNAEANYLTLVKRVEQASIEAPFSGYINQVFSKVGAMLGPGTPVFEIVDISSFKIQLSLGEQEIIDIMEGMKAEIRPKAVDSISLEGTVTTKAMSAGMSQQFAIEITAENKYPEILKGGMLADVFLFPSAREEVLSIPKSVVRQANGETFVFTVSEGIARKTRITTGRQDNLYLQVTGGLSDNDLVVSTGMDNLNDGQEVRIIREGSISVQ